MIIALPATKRDPSQPQCGILPQTSDAEKSDPSFHVLPRYWVPGDEVETRLANWPKPWLLDSETSPAVSLRGRRFFRFYQGSGVGNKFPLLNIRRSAGIVDLLLLANVNSIVFDYCTRQKIAGNSLNYFILKQLPVYLRRHFRNGMWNTCRTGVRVGVYRPRPPPLGRTTRLSRRAVLFRFKKTCTSCSRTRRRIRASLWTHP